jgi:hypothetical protein
MKKKKFQLFNWEVVHRCSREGKQEAKNIEYLLMVTIFNNIPSWFVYIYIYILVSARIVLLSHDYMKKKQQKVLVYYSFVFEYTRGIIMKNLFFLLKFSFMIMIIFYFKK